MNRAMWGTTTGAAAMLCASAALGAFEGMDYNIVGIDLVDGKPTYTIDVFLAMGAGERLDAVFGEAPDLKTLTTTGTFYQNTFGGPTSKEVNPNLYPTFPDLEFDSRVTIGCLDASGDPWSSNALSDTGIDWLDWEAGGDLSVGDGAWYVTPDDEQGQALAFTNAACEDRMGVLIARLTVTGHDSIINFAANFQGKDADGNTQGMSDSIAISLGDITDCNSNGVDDECDIANGDSEDSNDNGIPDECEDCNDNGIPDHQDIADGTSQDCNENGVPDECEKSEDCNDNGVPDECDIADGTLLDRDGNGIPDFCEGWMVYNQTQDILYTTIDLAINDADDGDWLLAESVELNAADRIDFDGRNIDVTSVNGDVNTNATVELAGGARLMAGSNADFSGVVRSGVNGAGSIESDTKIDLAGGLVARSGGGLELMSPDANLNSDGLVMGGGELFADGALNVSAGNGLYMLPGGSVVTGSGLNNSGSFYPAGTVGGDFNNAVDAQTRVVGDTTQIGDVYNDGLIAVHVGTYFIVGDLTNNGEILGDYDTGPGAAMPEAGDGFKVSGSYHTGQDASLNMPTDVWVLSVGGDFDVAINDASNFNMALATLTMSGMSGDDQDLERMSHDLGQSEDGLVQGVDGNYPIGTLRIASGTTVDVVDNHDNDNDGQKSCEAIYVTTLIVEAGATLNTNGCPIYYGEEAIIDGDVDDIDNILETEPPVEGDINGDGVVNIQDLLALIDQWGVCDDPDNCTADLTGDGLVNIQDLLSLLDNWGNTGG
jgi:hypothetical protein